jgi:prolipoprotein diacylglyceryltransferase
MFAAYLITYSIGRAFIESIRIDPSEYFFGLRTNVWSAIFGIAIGIALFVWSRRRNKGPETSVYLEGREPQESNVIDSKGTKAEQVESQT